MSHSFQPVDNPHALILYITVKNCTLTLAILCKFSLYSASLSLPSAMIITLFLPKKNLQVQKEKENGEGLNFSEKKTTKNQNYCETSHETTLIKNPDCIIFTFVSRNLIVLTMV